MVAIECEVVDALERYQRQHHIAGVTSFKQPLQYVESEISIPENSSGLARMFPYCYVDTHIRVYDCEELMAVVVPLQVTVHACEGNIGRFLLKRVFAPQGTVFSQ